MLVNFKVTKKQKGLIKLIIDRASIDGRKKIDKQHHEMNLCAAVANNPKMKIDLVKLLDFKEFDFWHDIWGIDKHMNRATGKIEGCFLPRCARE